MSIDLNGIVGFEYGSVVRKEPILVEVQPQQRVQPKQLSNESEVRIAQNDKKEDSLRNEYSFNLKRGNEYNLIGANSKIEDLDVTKAMSDIKKDSILEQYKFFVKTDVVNNEDGIVRRVIR